MMFRTVFLASCMAVTSATEKVGREAFRAQCKFDSSCGGEICCAAGWKMVDNTCANNDGSKCGLCGQTGMTPCDFTAESSMHPKLLDAAGNEVAVSTVIGSSLQPSTPITGASGHLLTPPPTTPSSGVSFVLSTWNGMAGWQDIPASAFHGFQGFLLGLTATVPSFYTAAGYTVSYVCNKNGVPNAHSSFMGCDIFFFVYRCPPCEARNNDIGQQLLAMDDTTWYAGNCGPTFKLNKDLGVEHQFAVYTAEIADGQTTTVTLDGPVEFMFWAMNGKSVICSAKTTEAECGASLDNCEWLAGADVCRPRGCEKAFGGFAGPSTPRCSVCVDDEAVFVPEVVFS